MTPPDPRIDAYIAKSAEFARPILSHLRSVVLAACPEAEETLKWGAPSFTYRGRILCSMAAFKQHASFGFWQGAQVTGNGPEAEREGMGQFGKLTRLSDLPGKRELTGYIRQAMTLIDSGAKRVPTRAAAPSALLEIPEDLAAALKKNAKARATFDGFAPSYRNDYIEWITEARREDTRQRRLEQAVEWLAEGKSRNWKYMKC